MSNFNGREDEYWRKQGYIAANAECSMAGRAKKDLFGFVDRVYVGELGQIRFVQITSTGNMQARVDKILHGMEGHGQHRHRMADVAQRLLKGTTNDKVQVLVVGWELNEERYRYERTERKIEWEELSKALSLSG